MVYSHWFRVSAVLGQDTGYKYILYIYACLIHKKYCIMDKVSMISCLVTYAVLYSTL